MSEAATNEKKGDAVQMRTSSLKRTAEEAVAARPKEEDQPAGEGCHSPDKKKRKKPQLINPESKARDICDAFFKTMDLDGNGFIEEEEIKLISIMAFDEDEETATARWKSMVTDMDKNGDNKISNEEYVQWWLNNTSDKLNDDGTFKEGYASYLLKSLMRISSVKTANDICNAFFFTMDANDDGFLVEDEIKMISKWAFGAKEDTAKATWEKMKDQMDKNKDNKISKEEYASFWLAQSKGKMNADGTFVAGYRNFLLQKLAKLKAGKKRQEQVKVWEKSYGDSKTASAPDGAPRTKKKHLRIAEDENHPNENSKNSREVYREKEKNQRRNK